LDYYYIGIIKQKKKKILNYEITLKKFLHFFIAKSITKSIYLNKFRIYKKSKLPKSVEILYGYII
jgi:hypothetical protein